MPIKDASHYRTPCEILREINDHAQGVLPNDKAIRGLVCELEIMLKGLLGDCPIGRFDENEDYEKDLGVRGDPGYRYEGESNLETKNLGGGQLKITRC